MKWKGKKCIFLERYFCVLSPICNHFKHRGHRQDPKCKVRHLIAMEAYAGEDHLRQVDLTNAGARLLNLRY